MACTAVTFCSNPRKRSDLAETVFGHGCGFCSVGSAIVQVSPACWKSAVYSAHPVFPDKVASFTRIVMPVSLPQSPPLLSRCQVAPSAASTRAGSEVALSNGVPALPSRLSSSPCTMTRDAPSSAALTLSAWVLIAASLHSLKVVAVTVIAPAAEKWPVIALQPS